MNNQPTSFQSCIAQCFGEEVFELINSDFSYTFYISLKLKSVSHSFCLAGYFVRQKRNNLCSINYFTLATRLLELEFILVVHLTQYTIYHLLSLDHIFGFKLGGDLEMKKGSG